MPNKRIRKKWAERFGRKRTPPKCGACACVYYTGWRFGWERHTCSKRTRPDDLQIVVEYAESATAPEKENSDV